MSLLTLFANVLWRGNGALEATKRKVAACLISRNNEPHRLDELSGLAPPGIDFSGCLAADACFYIIDDYVRLEIGHLNQEAKARLLSWVDSAIQPLTPEDYLKHRLAHHIIKEAEVDSQPARLFSIDLFGADAMLDAFWTDEHPWRGIKSPAHDGTEQLFVGDSLWSVQPSNGGLIRLNVSALIQRAGSPRPADALSAEASDNGVAAPDDSSNMPSMPSPPSLWGASGAAQDVTPGFAAPPPSMLPRPALFATAAVEHTGRAAAANALEQSPDSAAGAEHGPSVSALGFGAGGVHSGLLDLNLGSDLGGFGQGLGLRWPQGDRGTDARAGPVELDRKLDRLALGPVGGGSIGGSIGGATQAPGPAVNLFDPVEAAVEEVAAHVALEALGDAEAAAPGGGAAGAHPKRPTAVDAAAAGGALEPARTGGMAVQDTPVLFGAGRGWELFPSSGHGVAGGRSASDGAAAAGGGAERVAGGGNMSLLDELYMAFAPSGGGGGVASGGSPLSGGPRSLGGSELPSLGGRGAGQWGSPWGSGQEQPHSRAGDAAPLTSNGASLLSGGQLPHPPASLAPAGLGSGGLGSLDSGVKPGLPPSLLQGFGPQPIEEPQQGLYGQGTAPPARLPGFAPLPGTGLAGAPFGGSRPATQASSQPPQPWQDPAILNAGSAHPVGVGGGLGPGLTSLGGAGASGTTGPAGASSLFPPPSPSERLREPRVVPFQPPPPPLSLTRGALALANVGPPAVLPAAAMHGFDVAAAAAAAAGRGVVGAQAPVAQGMMPAAAAPGAAGALPAAPFALPELLQPATLPQQQSAGDLGARRDEALPPVAASVSSRSPSVAGAADSGVPTAADYAAAAARVWPSDVPKNVVRRIAATLLAAHGPAAPAAAGQHSMAWEPLLLGVRRQDPVACNRAGDLLATLDEDPTQCLSVTEAEGGGSEVVRLDLARMMSLAGPPPPAAPTGTAAAAPSAGGGGKPPSSLHRQTSFGASSTASTLREPTPPSGPGLSSAWLQSTGIAALGAAADPSRRPPRPSAAVPAALGAGWPPVTGSLAPAVLAAATAPQSQFPSAGTGQEQPQQQAFAAAAAAAAAMQAMQAAHGQARPAQGPLSVAAAAAHGAVPTQALLMQMQMLQQQQQSAQLGGLSHVPGLIGAGGQDPSVLLQLLQAQQQQRQQQQMQQQVQQLRLAQQAQQAQQLQTLLQRQAAAQQVQQAQQLLQKQQLQQLQQLMLLEQRRQQQQQQQAAAQAQLTPLISVLPVPPPSQTAALANLLQQFSAGGAGQAATGARPAIPPLPLAALPNVGSLLNAGGPVGQSQSHANVAAWLAAHSNSRGATPPPPSSGAEAALGQPGMRGSQQGDGSEAAAPASAGSAQGQERQHILQALLASVPQSPSQQAKLMEMLGAQPGGPGRRSDDGAAGAEQVGDGAAEPAVARGAAQVAAAAPMAEAGRTSEEGPERGADSGRGAAATPPEAQEAEASGITSPQQPEPVLSLRLAGLGSSGDLAAANGAATLAGAAGLEAATASAFAPRGLTPERELEAAQGAGDGNARPDGFSAAAAGSAPEQQPEAVTSEQSEQGEAVAVDDRAGTDSAATVTVAPGGPLLPGAGPTPSLSLQLQLLASATAARRAGAAAAAAGGSDAAAAAGLPRPASGPTISSAGPHLSSARPTSASGSGSAPVISPAHLLLAFPGLDTRAQALRTIAQVLLHSRHPQLGAAATDPGLLLLVLRQKGIFAAAPDSASLALLTSLLLSQPRFFRIVPPQDGGATAAGVGLGGGAAVQLVVEELLALLPPEGQEGLEARGGEAEAQAEEAARTTGAAEAEGAAAAEEPGLGAVAAAGGAPAAAGVADAARGDAAPQDESDEGTHEIGEPKAPSSPPAGPPDGVQGGAPGASSGSSSPEADAEAEEEQSDEAHLTTLMRLLATGARLEEEPLPDSPAQLRRQLSPLLEPPPLPVHVPTAGSVATALAPASAEPGAAAAEAPVETVDSAYMLTVPIPIPVPTPAPAAHIPSPPEAPHEAALSALPSTPPSSGTMLPEVGEMGSSSADGATDAAGSEAGGAQTDSAGEGTITAASAGDELASGFNASEEPALAATTVVVPLVSPQDSAQAAHGTPVEAPAASVDRPVSGEAAEPAAAEAGTATGSLGCTSEVAAEELCLPAPPALVAAPAEPREDEARAPPASAASPGTPATDGAGQDSAPAASPEAAAVNAGSASVVMTAAAEGGSSAAAHAQDPVAAPSGASSLGGGGAAASADGTAAAKSAAAAPGPSPSAAHLQPAAVRYISGLDVEAGCAEEGAALSTLAQHCAAAGRVVLDCAVAELGEAGPERGTTAPKPAPAAEASGAAAAADADAVLPPAGGSEGAEQSNGPAAEAAVEEGAPVAPASAGGGPPGSLVLVAVLVPAAQSWPTTLYVLGVAGLPRGSGMVRVAAGLLAGSGPGGAVKVVWDSAQVLPALSCLLPGGARVAPVQDLRTLVSLASAGTMAAASGAAEAAAADAVHTATSGAAPRPARPWAGMVSLQERLAQLGVAGRDLASLAALGAEAWVVHPLSCVVEAAAARHMCQVLEARRALLFGDEALLDSLLCAVSQRLAAEAGGAGVL